MSSVIASEECEKISEDEIFLPYDLSPAVLTPIQTRRLIECKVIQSAFLAKRKLKHLSDIPQYVLGLERFHNDSRARRNTGISLLVAS